MNRNSALSPYPDGDLGILACPNCGSGEFMYNEDGNRNRYCGQCGQAIDWIEADADFRAEPNSQIKLQKDGRSRSNLRIGDVVDIVLKQDQPTGKLTRGVVARLLTNSPTHPHGIKVLLTNGQVGRVQVVYSANRNGLED